MYVVCVCRLASTLFPCGASTNVFLTSFAAQTQVICGRGGFANHHEGNQAYLKKKECMQEAYKSASNATKTQMKLELIAFVHNRGGRFIRRNTDGAWEELDNREVRNKAAQALRDLPASRRKASQRAATKY